MPTMTGFSNVKSYYFPSVTQGSLLYIPKDSLVFVNTLNNQSNRMGSIGWSKGLITATIYGIVDSLNGIEARHYGSFVPSGATVSVFQSFNFVNIYLYVIELDNDEPNA